ncbi:anti-anti sigma factor protein [Sorangium cellulosum]|uniref:histidine kinase n=1 Tax=Sorangium cellulosum TaxID=56 RepID=A0A2L0FB57_SORCE|nr:PAS domain-containing protein [Sorangium cellulosum]AUX48794.1 anti-anti sigma factor protein [Sorangium cellulosum]
MARRVSGGAFDVSIPHSLVVRVSTGEGTASYRMRSTVTLHVTPKPWTPLAIFLDVAEPAPQSVELAAESPSEGEFQREQAEELRKVIVQLVRARLEASAAERLIDLLGPLGRALGAEGPVVWAAAASSARRERTDESGRPAEDAAEAEAQGESSGDVPEQLKFFAEAMPLQVWFARPDGRLSYLNQKVLQYFGRTQEQMIGEGWLGVLHPDDVQKTADIWIRCIQGGIPYQSEFRGRRADQTYREFAACAMPQRDRAGNVVRWIGACIDAADLLSTEAALRRSEARYRLFAEASNEGIWFWDFQDKTSEWSDRMIEMTGVPFQKDDSYESVIARIHPDDRGAFRTRLKRHFEVREPFEIEFRLRTSSDEYREFRARGKAQWDDKGVPIRMAGGIVDITEQKRAEAVMKERLEIIEQQQDAIRALSTPIIEVWEGVLTMPVFGALDGPRSQQMMEVLLEEVVRTGCRHTIIDLTGVSTLDNTTAEHIIKLINAVKLLGSQGIVVGIRPEVARTVVSLGVELSQIRTLSNLREALLFCMQASNTLPLQKSLPVGQR